jgi:hypothetical protein
VFNAFERGYIGMNNTGLVEPCELPVPDYDVPDQLPLIRQVLYYPNTLYFKS